MRYFIKFSYNGSNYHGWQIQPNAKTVQNELQKCLSILLQKNIELVGAGRTDAGVHAKQMFAHFNYSKNIENNKIIHKLNSFLPNDIFVIQIFKVKDQSHARFSAVSRTYKYYISHKIDIFNPNVHVVRKDLNVEKMNKASKHIVGEKDFTSFSKLHSETFTSICNVLMASWEIQDDKLVFTITSNRFLRNMVRSIVGTLIDVGLSKIQEKDLIDIINQKDRSAAGVSVPAKALFITNISYPKNI